MSPPGPGNGAPGRPPRTWVLADDRFHDLPCDEIVPIIDTVVVRPDPVAASN